MKNKIKKFFSSKKNTAIFVSALLIFVLATSITFAWFKNIFTVEGVEMNTGMFEYQFLGYSGTDMKSDFKYSTNSADSDYKYIGDMEGITAASDVSKLQEISPGQPGVLYYVVRKTAGSIDLDVSLSFDADFSQLVRYSKVVAEADGTTDPATDSIGSFWYSISSLKGKGTSFSDLNSIETYIKSNEANFTRLTKGEKNYYFPDIRKEIISESLGSEDAFVCFRVEYGVQGATPANAGITVPLGVTLHVAQKGGLGEYTGKTHRVFTLDELNTALTVYQPRDTIIIAGNIEYKGDLNIDNLLNIVIENGSLIVKGNMRYTYAGTSYSPDSDTPTISKFEIQIKSGFLKILQMDAADVGEGVNAGGNLYLDIPNSTMSIFGQNDPATGNADIYIQNQFSANTAYADKGESASGLILSNVRICETDVAETAKSVYLREDTQLTVGQGVSLGTVYAIHDFYDSTSSLRLHVQNYGTIDKIDFSAMQFINISDPLPYTPRILIDNYSIITKPITLANFSRKWDPNTPDVKVTASAQNTRVIWEQGAQQMTIDNTNQSNFTTADIESIYKVTLIDKVDNDPNNIVIHYMANKLEGLGNTDGLGITTIEKLLEYYQIGIGSSSHKIGSNEEIKSLKIICYTGYYLTEADYAAIRSLTNVEVIDLSEAESASDATSLGGAVPDGAFENLIQLEKLTLSDKDVKWGANLFKGTKIDEITLPVRLTTLHPDALVNIKYLHMGNKSAQVYPTEFMSRVMSRDAYIFCTDAARDDLISRIEAADETTVGSYKERTEGAPTTTQLNKIANIRLEAQRYGDYFLTLYDDSCRVVAYIPEDGKTFNAANEQNNQSTKHADGNVYRFTFSEFDIVTYDADGNVASDNKYDIVEYDDFAFYQINVGENSDTLTFNEKLNAIGDAAFYNAGFPTKVDLGGCKTLGHAAIAKNSAITRLAGLYVETAGYYACGEFTKIQFVNFPRLSWVYGNTFYNIGTSNTLRRMDVGLVQTAPDAIPEKTNYADSLTGSARGNFGDAAIIIHTDYDHASNITELTMFTYGSGPYKALVTDEYKAMATSAKYGNFPSLGTYTADDLKFMTFGGVDVTGNENGNQFEPGDLAYLQISGTSDYKLLCNIGWRTSVDLSVYSVDGVYTLPAYSDEKGTTTTVGGGALHYISFSGAHTLTFANSYTTISAGGFGPSDNSPSEYNKNKYFAHIDFNNVETIGEKTFWGWPSLLTVKGNKVTSFTGKSVFQDCKNLTTVSLPNLKGSCEQAFYNCIGLKMVLVGGITGLNVFGVNASTGISSITDLILFINAKDVPENNSKVYLTGNGGKVGFSVVSIGGEFHWDASGNSPYLNTDSDPNNDVDDPYSLAVVDADISGIIFTDWKTEASVTVNLDKNGTSTYTYTFSTPTYMFSEEEDGLTIQLSFGLGNITGTVNEETGESHYTIPNTLYKSSETITTILGNETVKYYTTNVAGTTSSGKNVVGIEDNIYNGGKITVDNIEFPTGLKKIGKNAFAGCTFRNDINITGKESGLVIEDGAFSGVTTSSLKITNVTEIGKEAFKEMKDVDSYGASKAMRSIELGDKLSSIGESAFEGANAESVTTTHESANPIILTIGENAFKNLKNGTGGEVTVSFSNAVVDFGSNSFYNVKMKDLTAPNTILVRADAFYKTDISGTVDFSHGIPSEMVAAHGTQVIEPYGFRGTSGDKNQLGTIKLGQNCLLMGDYDSKDNIYPIVENNQEYKGAFHYCDIKALHFNETEAQEPQAIAFVGCSFKEIRLAALTTLGINNGGVGSTDNSQGDVRHQFYQKASAKVVDNKAWTNFIFVDCTTLGDVYFTNITDFKFTIRGGSNHEITLHDLKITELKSDTFKSLKLVGDSIKFPADMTIAAHAFEKTTVNVDLIFGANTRITGSEAFRDSTFNGDVFFEDGLTITASYPFNRSKINGTVSIGSVSYTHNSSNNGMFGAASGNMSNAYTGYVKNLVFRDTCTSVPDRLLAYCNFDVVDLTHIETLGNGAFAHSVVGEIIGMDGVKTIGNNAFGVLSTATHVLKTTVTKGLDISNVESIGEGAFVNLTFNDAVSLSKILEIKANAFKNCTFNQPLAVGSAIGTDILDSAFEGAKFNSSIDLAGVKTVGASAFKGATFSETLQLKDITSFGASAFTNAIVNGDLIFGTRAEDGAGGAGGYTYTGPASAIGESAFGSLTTYDADGTTVLSYLPGVTVTGEVNFVNVKGIDKYGFRGAVLSSPITFGADINIGDSAFYGVIVPAVTFVGSPVIQANAFKGSNITTLTFQDAGEIQAEAFAEGIYGTIKLGSVTLIEGTAPENIREATQEDMPTGWIDNRYWMADNPVGAFRASSIGSVYFEDAAEPGFLSFGNCIIGYLDLGNVTSLGAKEYNKNDNNGTFSAFQKASISHLNLGEVAYIGNSYFVGQTFDIVNPVETDITVNWWTFSGVTFKGDLVFNGLITIDGFAFHGACNVQGDLKFMGGVNATSNCGQQSIKVYGDMYIQKFTNTTYLGASGNRSMLSGAKIYGTFTVAEGALMAGFHNTVFYGNVDLTGVTGIPDPSATATDNQVGHGGAFRGCTFTNPVITLPSVEGLGVSTFASCKFAPGTAIYLSNATEIDQSAFADSKNLSLVVAPNVQTIGSNAFLNCTSLTAIDLPALTAFTGTSPFVGCTELRSVIIGDKFTNWGTGAFDATNTALESVILETPIEVNIQDGKPSVTNITGIIALPDNASFLVAKALEAAYDSYFKATKYNEAGPIWGSITPNNFGTVEMVLRDDVSGVNYLATLLYGDKIEIVDIIDTANVTRNAAFTFPSTISDGTTTYTVASISGLAMSRITKTVTTIGLPSTMEYINFSGLDTHDGVLAYSIEDSSLYQVIDGALYTADGKTLVLYPTGKVGNVDVSATVEYVGAYAFAGNQSIQTVTFRSNVTISDGAFADCYGLTTIIFDAVTVDGTAYAPVVRFIGRNTISGCSRLTAIQADGTSNPEVMYDTEIFSLIELAPVEALPIPEGDSTSGDQTTEGTEIPTTGGETGGAETPAEGTT